MVVLLLVVVAAVGGVKKSLERGERRVAEVQLRNLASAIQAYSASNFGKLPSTLEDLTQPSVRNPEPFLESIPKDPWDQPFEYRITGTHEFHLRSIGRDGVPDSADDLSFPKPGR